MAQPGDCERFHLFSVSSENLEDGEGLAEGIRRGVQLFGYNWHRCHCGRVRCRRVDGSGVIVKEPRFLGDSGVSVSSSGYAECWTGKCAEVRTIEEVGFDGVAANSVFEREEVLQWVRDKG
ncbi:hypothetical protein Z517_09159 [Fonsecaea pedrosoi CBS 271.37]|uniref:Uncharacterized protein n=1 Tax=Fonsecaea pedrosoi CBS 271.37 TaxID=1442368 RepID=A0A0D2GDE8_9EURO|nr:uncharacterized protein Z517_09159 [Fonsecaea pedrosoi CBS 271.37]KIW76715.1 hypothetical protein Z517_09159 [Fonsecaea pedrosoi CBS 271.37]